jgi:hypothetical protein
VTFDRSAEESAALCMICTHLVAFREEAQRDNWSSELDRALYSLRGGKTPAQVWENLNGLRRGDGTSRASTRDAAPDSLSDLGIKPMPISGEYACPYSRCSRSATPDANGYEPTCADGTPMHFRGAHG